jgi:hypothetical protein
MPKSVEVWSVGYNPIGLYIIYIIIIIIIIIIIYTIHLYTLLTN